MFKVKKKSHVSIELNDYVLRALVSKGPNLVQPQCYEIPLPQGLMQDAMLEDEMALYEIVKEYAPKWGGKHQNVRFFVPDTSVLLKAIEHPTDVESKDLRSYVEMEIGHSIHLPFQEPLVDVYDPVPSDGKAVIFAAPPEEVRKWMGILLDNHLKPQVADIRALANLRLLEHLDMVNADRTYLIADWSINEVSICIYSAGNVEFLRFQSIDTDLTKWQHRVVDEANVEFSYDGDIQDYRMIITDQVLELDRMMNFFRFSLHKGEKSVDEIMILGDNPLLTTISEFLSENFTTPIQVINDAIIEKKFPGFKAKHASLLGLALKEVKG
ncbi:pilus assembly protein PilM [Lysinibacillus sp. KU-BSD001]|uniref:type IV pilus biogenesis protein PilM n=1 Tax=Lysinibacillus sp. KU-BSD001 TaxID=3141328 RepID=UPI0036ED0E1E